MKEKIKLAAIELFESKGFTNTSMREIAEALDVSKAALYYHYKSKEDIFKVILEDSFTMMNDFIVELPEKTHSIWEFLEIWIKFNVEMNAQYPGMRRLIFFVIIGRFNKQIEFDVKPHLVKSLEIFRHVIQKGVENKEIRSDIDPELLIKFLFSGLNGTLDEFDELNLIPISGYSNEELTSNILSLFKGGIQAHA